MRYTVLDVRYLVFYVVDLRKIFTNQQSILNESILCNLCVIVESKINY